MPHGGHRKWFITACSFICSYILYSRSSLTIDTHKHTDSDLVLMQNSMFIRKIFNKHFVFLQRNCTSVKVLQNAAEPRGVKQSLQSVSRVGRPPGSQSHSLTAWQHLPTFIRLGWSSDFHGEMGKQQQPSWIKVCWLLAGDPRWQLYHTHMLRICAAPEIINKERKNKDTVHQLSILIC